MHITTSSVNKIGIYLNIERDIKYDIPLFCGIFSKSMYGIN